ncbi:MAG: HD domain-containing phosphohydrolase, partial [Planctomycetota bacterium]
LQEPREHWLDEILNYPCLDFIHPKAVTTRWVRSIENCFQILSLEKDVARRTKEVQELTRIGIALSAERDLDALLKLILNKAMDITASDAATLYLVETNIDDENQLRFKLSFCRSLPLNYKEFTIPINRQSIAGFAAQTGKILNLEDCYQLPANTEYSFNYSFDHEFGYRTKSMLVVPMIDHQNKVIGVLQLINKKKEKDLLLDSTEACLKYVEIYDIWCEEMVFSLASQAAISIENTSLYQDIENLFEGFVHASVTAIESRDPTTSGHSERVATLTVALAEKISSINNGKFRSVRFTRDQIKEIRYASLLHDFGKVAVREQVLLKAKKLYPYALESIQDRFTLAKRDYEILFWKTQTLKLIQHPSCCSETQLHQEEQALKKNLDLLDKYLDIVIHLNEPTVLEEGSFETLQEIKKLQYKDRDGQFADLLYPEEVSALSIRRGSLDNKERSEIESHVTYTYKFLSKIPWTEELKSIPQIAYAHHEKINGYGYPLKLHGADIPLQAKIMTVADIFDALTASDRPYKSALSVEKAERILRLEVESDHLDVDLVDIFIQSKIYELVAKKPSK